MPAPAKILQLDIKKKMSEERVNFLNLYVEYGGDAKRAWTEAGFSPTTVKRAMVVVREEWDTVQRLMHMRIGTHVPMALEGIVQIAKHGKQESVRLKALQDILARAGYDKAQEVVITDKPTDELDNKELEAELLRLLQEA